MSQELLDDLSSSLEDFLTIWTKLMGNAGYLAHTTAKRQDCIDSFIDFMEAIRSMAPTAGIPDFAQMMRDNKAGAATIVETARNHRLRGITTEMFLGCFKTLIHSIEEILLNLDAPAPAKLETLLKIRRVSDVLETVFINDWEQAITHGLTEQLQDVNRQLTLKKNRYENIFRSTSDLVILTDEQGLIAEVNPETNKYVQGEQLIGKPFWEDLALNSTTMAEVLQRFPIAEPHEVCSANQQRVFSMSIIPLSQVSLASQGYMLILSDITLLVNHRQVLERRVEKRTAALKHSQNLLSQEKAQIEEMNVTLRNVMKTIESDRQEREQSISRKIRADILPALDKIKNEPATLVRSSFLELVREQLISLTTGFSSELDASMLKLSRTELRICRFIQAGCSSKEISETMNLAFDTIRTHRKNIRRKLGLQGKDINLHTFLASRSSTADNEV